MEQFPLSCWLLSSSHHNGGKRWQILPQDKLIGTPEEHNNKNSNNILSTETLRLELLYKGLLYGLLDPDPNNVLSQNWACWHLLVVT